MLRREQLCIPHNRPHERRGERGTTKVPQPDMETRHQERIPKDLSNPLLQLQQRKAPLRKMSTPSERVISSSLQGDFLVSRSHMREGERGQRTEDTCGRKCSPSSGMFAPTGSSLKTCVDLLLGTTAWYSKPCALTWKAKVTKSNRLLYQLVPSVRHTGEIESGLLPTLTASDSGHGHAGTWTTTQISVHNIIEGKGKQLDGSILKAKDGAGTGLKLQPSFVEWMMGFPDKWTELPSAQADTGKND